MKIQELWQWLWNPTVDGPRSSLFIRLMTGGVFLWEGIMKFVYPNLGVGRFTKLGFPAPGLTAGFVAWVEIIGGVLFIVGWLTRPVAVAFIIEMIVAMLSTKIGVYLGNSPLGQPPAMPKIGLGAVLHDIRSDYAQIMTSIFLLFAGPGPLSVDAKSSKDLDSPRLGRLTAVAALLLVVAGGSQASQSFSAGASAPAAVADAFTQGQEAIKRRDYKAASGFFRRALQDQPNNPDVLNMLGFSERKQGNLDEALEYYQKALTLRPRFPEAREYLGEAHLQAALQELNALRSYGAAGKEESEELAQAVKEAAKGL
jgi:putative oxidoreductase